MVFDFFPWTIDVDIEGTKRFYQDNDYSINKEWNKVFINSLNIPQYDFFDRLGIDLMKVEIERHELKDVEVILDDEVSFYDELGLEGTGIRFKHPISHFDEKQFEKWDCGFINGALIVRG